MGLRGGFAISYTVVVTRAWRQSLPYLWGATWGAPWQAVPPGSLAAAWALPSGALHCPGSLGSLCHLHVPEKHHSACCAGLVLQVVFRKKYQMQTVIIF